MNGSGKNMLFQFEDMTNLSKELRAKLAKDFSFPSLRIETTQHSADGTIKNRFKTFDNHFVEGVLIPTTMNAEPPAFLPRSAAP